MPETDRLGAAGSPPGYPFLSKVFIRAGGKTKETRNFPVRANRKVSVSQLLNAHMKEILNLIRNAEKQEKGEQRMERLITILDEEEHTLITTTGIHLARRIGEALSHAYQGNLDFTYGDAEKSIRVTWSR